MVSSGEVFTIFAFVAASAVGPAVVLGVLGGLGFLVLVSAGGRGLVVDLGFELGEELNHAKLVGIGGSDVGLENGWGRMVVDRVRAGVVWNSGVQFGEESFDDVDAWIGVAKRGGSSSV